MKSFAIEGAVRETVGKKETKKLRAEGKVPCVLYGGEETIHFYAEASAFHKVVYTPNVYLIDLDIDGTIHKAIIQDIQFHPVEEQILHVDFLKINEDKPVKIDVPINVHGYAAGMRSGGKLKVNLRRLKVKALAKDLPDHIDIDITNLELGQSFKVDELKSDKLEFLNSKSVPVVSVMITRAARAAADDDVTEAEVETDTTEATTEPKEE